MKVLSLLLIFLFSCSEKEISLEKKLSSIEYHVQWTEKVLNSYPLSKKTFINGPPGTWTTLLELSAISSARRSFDLCLLYRFPDKGQKDGQFKFAFKDESECSDFYFRDEGIVIDKIETLWHQKNKDSCEYEFSLRRENKIKSLCLNFLNQRVLKSAAHYQVGDSSALKRKLGLGAIVLPESSKSYPGVKRELRGSRRDRFQSEQRPVLCEKVTKNCKTEGLNTCDHCRWGWIEVIDSNCPKQGSKFCALDRCGQKGEPACFRGREHIGSEEKDYCQDKSIGFCQFGLEPVCRDGILLCL